MGNLCPCLNGLTDSAGINERSHLIANQHSASRSSGATESQQSRRVLDTPYTAVSVPTRKLQNADGYNLQFGKVGLPNLDKRLSDIASLYNSLLEKYSRLKTGLNQLKQIAQQILPCDEAGSAAHKNDGDDDYESVLRLTINHICTAARQDDAAAGSDSAVSTASLQLKQHGRDWTELVFDSKLLSFDEISLLNLFNLLSRYAWELRSKSPPLRNTVAMTTKEEESFRRDLLVASLGAAGDTFGANFDELRRLDDRLAEFLRFGEVAGANLAAASRICVQ